MALQSDRLKQAINNYVFANAGIIPEDESFMQLITEVYDAGHKDATDKIPEIAIKAIIETLEYKGR